jgi:predicted metal-dependent phosphoesterase TrpH
MKRRPAPPSRSHNPNLPSSVDLHTHTTASDGTLSPAALFSKALELKIRVLSITDHDSTAGLEAVQPLASAHPEMRIIPGLEMSAEGELYCHLLGYFVDPKARGFQERLIEFRRRRLERIAAMAKKLNTLGIPVEYERVVALAAGGAVGRPHLADALVEKGVVRSRQEAFDRYLKRDGPAYIAGAGPAAADIIQFIRSAKGIPVLAHPSYYTTPELLERLVAAGLMGLEVYYPEHSRSLIRRYLDMAQTSGLVATGGSDFHGPKTHRSALACVDVPESVVEALENARARV